MIAPLPRRRGRLSRALQASAVVAVLAAGCSPAGTGTVEIKNRDSIRENLSKGAKPASPSKPDDEVGIKFRGKKGD